MSRPEHVPRLLRSWRVRPGWPKPIVTTLHPELMPTLLVVCMYVCMYSMYSMYSNTVPIPRVIVTKQRTSGWRTVAQVYRSGRPLDDTTPLGPTRPLSFTLFFFSVYSSSLFSLPLDRISHVRENGSVSSVEKWTLSVWYVCVTKDTWSSGHAFPVLISSSLFWTYFYLVTVRESTIIYNSVITLLEIISAR